MLEEFEGFESIKVSPKKRRVIISIISHNETGSLFLIKSIIKVAKK